MDIGIHPQIAGQQTSGGKGSTEVSLRQTNIGEI
jgi:hypothetical protein